MHNVKLILDPEEKYAERMKGRDPDGIILEIKSVMAEISKLRGDIQMFETEKKSVTKLFQTKKENVDYDVLSLQGKILAHDITARQGSLNIRYETLNALLNKLPNLPLACVPEGGEESNIEKARYGTPRVFDFEPKDHVTIGEAMGLMDFEQTSKISGSRFVTLKGALARMESVLGRWMLDMNGKTHGYEEVSPALIVRPSSMYGTGQFPKFKDQAYVIDEENFNDNKCLIPTAEVPLTNMVRERLIDYDELPLRMTANTPCFRSEAGSTGKDTRGMTRLHQFYKTELVTICHPDQSSSTVSCAIPWKSF